MPLFAVHLSDGTLSAAWTAAGFAGAGLLLLMALLGLHEDEIPRIGLLAAAFFVGSSIHLPLGVLPTSVHLILNGLVGVVLGRRAPLAIVAGLVLQYFLLHHGGLSTLGVNTCIIAIPAILAGLAYPVFKAVRVPAFASGVLLGGGAVALTVGLNFLVLLFGGKEDWSTLARLVLLAHIPIVILEAIMLGAIVRYVEAVKPELLAAHRTNALIGSIQASGNSHSST